MNLNISSTKPLVSDGKIAEDCPSHTGEEWLAILQEKSLVLGKPIPWYDIKQDPELNHKEILEKLGPYSAYENKLLVVKATSEEQNRDTEKAPDFHLEPSMVPERKKAETEKIETETNSKRTAKSSKSGTKVSKADEGEAVTAEAKKGMEGDESQVEPQNVSQQDLMERHLKERVEATIKPPTEHVVTKRVPDPIIGVDANIVSQTIIPETLDQKSALELVKLLDDAAVEEMRAHEVDLKTIKQLTDIRALTWRNAPKIKKTANVVSLENREVCFLEGQLIVVPKFQASQHRRLAPDDILCMFTSSGILDGGREPYFSCIRMCKKLETGGWGVTEADLEGYVQLSSTMKGFRDSESILRILGGHDPWRIVKRVMATKAKQLICEISNRDGNVIGYVYMEAIKPTVFKNETLTLYFYLFEIDCADSASKCPMSTDCLIYRQQYQHNGDLQIMIQQTTSFSV